MNVSRSDIHDFAGYSNYLNHFADAGDISTLGLPTDKAQELSFLFAKNEPKDPNILDNIEYHTHQYPHAFKGRSVFLGALTFGLEMNSSMDFVLSSEVGIPIFYTDEQNFSYKKYYFTRGLMDIVPEEAPARYLRFRETSGSATSQRYAIAHYVESNWFWTSEGQDHFGKTIKQLSNTVRLTIQMHAVASVFKSRVKLYEHEIKMNLLPNFNDWIRILRDKAENFMLAQKSKDGMFNLIIKSRQILGHRGYTPNALWIPYGGKLYFKDIISKPADVHTIVTTSETIAASRSDPDSITSFMGVRICEIEDFTYDEGGGLPVNPARGEAAFGQYAMLSGHPIGSIDPITYKTSDRNIWMMNLVHDKHVIIDLPSCLNACYIFDNPDDPGGDYGVGYHLGFLNPGGGGGGGGDHMGKIRKATPIDDGVANSRAPSDLFGVRESDPRNGAGTGNKTIYRFANFLGEISKYYLTPELIEAMAKKVAYIYKRGTGGVALDVDRMNRDLAPYHVSTMFQKHDVNREEIVRSVVNTLFEDIEGVQLLPVTYAEGMFEDEPADLAQENFVGEVVGGRYTDKDGRRFFADAGEMHKKFPHTATDLYGIDRSIKKYNQMSSLPTNVYDHMADTSATYPKGTSNLLTNLLYLRGIVMRENSDYNILRRKMVATGHELVREHGHNVHIHEVEDVLQAPPAPVSVDTNMDLDITPTGAPVRRVDYSKSAYDGLSRTEVTNHWAAMNGVLETQFEQLGDTAHYTRVANFGSDKEHRMLIGKTFTSLLNKNVPMAQNILRDLSSHAENKDKQSFSKALKEAHYKFADHEILPQPQFEYIEDSGAGAAMGAGITHVPATVALGAPIRIKRQILTAIPEERQIDVLNSVDATGEHYVNNKKILAHIGVFKMDDIMNYAKMGARIIPLDENYNPVHPDAALLSDENPKHSFEISSATTDNKVFEVQLQGGGGGARSMTATGAGLAPRRYAPSVPPNSKSVFNSDKYRDMETELLAVLSKRSPGLMTWVLMSKEGSSEESRKFKVKNGTLSSFIINGPRFNLDPAEDATQMNKINTTLREKQRDVKRDVPIPALQDVQAGPNITMDPNALKDAYVNTFYPNTNPHITQFATDIRNAYAPAVFQPVHMRQRIRTLMEEGEANAGKNITDARFRFFVSALDTCSTVWEELHADVTRATATGNDDANVNSATLALKICMGKYAHNQLISRFLKQVFLGAGVPAADNMLTLRSVAGAPVGVQTTFGLLPPAAAVAPALVAVAGTTWDLVITFCQQTVEAEDFTNTTRVLYDSLVSTSLLMREFGETGANVLHNRELATVCKEKNVNMNAVAGGNPLPATPVAALKRANDLVTAKIRSETTTLNVTMDRVKARTSTTNILDISHNDMLYIEAIVAQVNLIIDKARVGLSQAPNIAQVNVQLGGTANLNANLQALANMVRNGTNTAAMGAMNAVAGNTIYNAAGAAGAGAYIGVPAGRLPPDHIFIEETYAAVEATAGGGAGPVAAATALRAAMPGGYVLGSNIRIPIGALVAFHTANAFDVSGAIVAGDFVLPAGIQTPDQTIRNEVYEKCIRPYLDPNASYNLELHYLKLSTGVVRGRWFGNGFADAANETAAAVFANNVFSNALRTRRREQRNRLAGISMLVYDILQAETDNILPYVVAATTQLVYFLSSNARDADKAYETTRFATYMDILSRSDDYTYTERWTEVGTGGVMQFNMNYGIGRIGSSGLGDIAIRVAAALSVREPNIYKTVYLTLKTLKIVLMKNRAGNTWEPNSVAAANNFKLCSIEDTGVIIDKLSSVYINRFTNAQCRVGGAEIAVDWVAYNVSYTITSNTFSGLYANNKLGEFMDEVIMKSKTCNFGKYRSVVPTILQNNTQFYWDVYRIASHMFNSGFNGQMKNIVAHGKFKEIADILIHAMNDFEEGREIIAQAARFTYGSIDYAARSIIWALFGSSVFSEKVREVLSRLDSLRSSFKNLMKTAKNVFDMHFNHVFDYSNDPTVLGTDTYANVGETPAYTGVFAQIGMDMDMAAAGIANGIRDIVRNRLRNTTGVYTIYKAPNFRSEAGLAIRLRQLLKSVILSDELPLGIPSLINDIFMLGSVETRTNLINKIRKEFYSEYFVDVFNKASDISSGDWGYSDLEHFMAYAKGIDDPDVRKAFIKLLFCKPSKKFWEWVMKNDVIFPFDFMVARPYIKMRTCSGVIADWRGGKVGRVAVGTPNVMYQDDGIIKAHSLHLHNYFCGIIDGVDAMLFWDHIWAEDFICGHGTTFFDKEDMNVFRNNGFRLPSGSAGITEEHPSMFALMVPYNCETILDIIDLRGKFIDDFNRKVPLHFTTTKAFFDNTGIQTNSTGAHPYYPRAPDCNFICYRTHYKFTHPKVNGLIVNLSSCPLGINQANKMVSKVIRRSNINEPVFKDMGYETMTSTLNLSMVRA